MNSFIKPDSSGFHRAFLWRVSCRYDGTAGHVNFGSMLEHVRIIGLGSSFSWVCVVNLSVIPEFDSKLETLVRY